MFKVIRIVLVSAMVLPCAVGANSASIGQLKSHCDYHDAADANNFLAGLHTGYCDGMIYGVVHGTGIKRNDGVLPTRRALGVCLPTDSEGWEWVTAFRQWAEKRPERWSEPMELGIIESLKEAYPCR